MDSSLLDLLRKHHNPNSNKYTHISSYGPSSKWCISPSNLESFWDSYCNLIKNKKNKNNNFCLSEIQNDNMPVMAEFTLKFNPMDASKETFGNDFILAVVYCYQQAMLEIFNTGETSVELVCCVLSAKEYMEDNLLISSFKLHFPYCKTPGGAQTRLLRPLVLQMLRSDHVMSRLSHEPVNSWETIINPLTVESPCLLYGSSSNPNTPKYELEFILPKIEMEHIDNEEIIDMELEESFYPANHEHVRTGVIQAGMFANTELDNWLPIFFSVLYTTKITLPKQEIPNKITKQSSYVNNYSNPNSVRPNSNSLPNDENDGNRDMATLFLSMMNRERVESDNYWIDVGKSLYGTFAGEYIGLEMWIQFTERSDNHSGDECRNLYNTFYETKFTIKTLAWYAKEDSPDEYHAWHQSWCAVYLEKATSCLDSDVAEALYRVYWLEFACANLTKNILYQFKNNIWKKQDNGVDLRKYISGDFISIFEKYRTTISIEIQEANDIRFKESAETMVKKIGILINKLRRRTFKNTILAESMEKFYVNDFMKKLDSNPDLMGMVNGVLEACPTEAVMRNGKPEDYVSKSSGLIWRYDMHDKHPLMIKLMSWLTKVFPDKDLLDYVGKMFGSCIKGKNSDKLFPIMTGKGDNSKSMIKKVFECAFGDYCITFPTTLFTSKRSGGPDPSVARSKYAHVAFAQEPDADDPLKNGTIKEMTGGDRFFARFLHDDGGEIEPMFTLFLMCNQVPIIPHSDKAMKNRVRLVPYLGTWVSNPPASMSERYKKRLFKKDKFFEAQIPEMAPAFMYYCTQMYNKYIKEGLVQPKLVTTSTEEYWQENDVYMQFINENIERAYKIVPNWPENQKKPVDEDAKISIANIYTRFKDWHREVFTDLKCPGRPIVKTELEQRMGQTKSRVWRGIKFKFDMANVADI